MNLLKGQKTDVTKGRLLTELLVELVWQTNDVNMEIDGAAFLLDGSGKCQNDEQFIFYGNPVSQDGAVSHQSSIHKNEITIKLNRLKNIPEIAITLTIHEGEERGYYFKDVTNAILTLKDKQTGDTITSFPFGHGLDKETAIVVGELYLHNGEWKLNPIGSGFYGGLAALCQNFGIDVETESKPAHTPEPVVQEAPKPVPLNITLKKKESISIQKTEKIVATLEWNKNKDLDLYCFYVLKDGTEGKVYYRNKGNAAKAPYITLDGDAQGSGKETIIVHRPSEINYVLFAAYSAISNGFGSFKSMKAKAVVDNQMGQVVTSPLFENNKFAYWVAIAKIDLTDPKEMKVMQVEKYSKSGTERSPLLYRDGSFEMNVGPEEFK
jgi:stress response protein SCP2